MKRLRPPLRIIAGNMWPLAALALAGGLVLTACREGPSRRGPSPPVRTPSAGAGAVAPADPRPVVLVVGTSLTAGLGVDPSEAYPALLQEKVDAAGLHYHVVNAGVSGETSAGALRRMDWLLRRRVDVLVVETGANDGLRGQDPEATRVNIQGILDRARRQSPPPRLVVVAMEALPNYGEDYRSRFRAIYPELAEENEAILVPFPLEGVAGDPELNQADGIHPTAEGHRRLAANVWRFLEPVLIAGERRSSVDGAP